MILYCEILYRIRCRSYNWVYPRLNPVPELDPSIHRKDPEDISIEKIASYLKSSLDAAERGESSAVVINYGLHLVRSTSFENYKRLIAEVIKIFKKFKGEIIWRTTTSAWQQETKVHKRFQTNQVNNMTVLDAFNSDVVFYYIT